MFYCYRFSPRSPFRAKDLWLFFNQKSSILVSFRHRANLKVDKWDDISGELTIRCTERQCCLFSAMVSWYLPLYFHSLERELPSVRLWVGKTQGKWKECSMLVFIESWISYLIKIIHRLLYSFSFSSYIFLGGYFPHNNSNKSSIYWTLITWQTSDQGLSFINSSQKHFDRY